MESSWEDMGNWQYLVAEKDRLGSEDAFWAKFGSPGAGGRLGCAGILRVLQGEHAEKDRRDANDALWFFGGYLARHKRFTWKTGDMKEAHVMQKVECIAREWQDLLETDTEIDADWERKKGKGERERGTVVNEAS